MLSTSARSLLGGRRGPGGLDGKCCSAVVTGTYWTSQRVVTLARQHLGLAVAHGDVFVACLEMRFRPRAFGAFSWFTCDRLRRPTIGEPLHESSEQLDIHANWAARHVVFLSNTIWGCILVAYAALVATSTALRVAIVYLGAPSISELDANGRAKRGRVPGANVEK